MIFSNNDPKFAELYRMQEVLSMWAEFERVKDTSGINVIGRLMDSVRKTEKRHKKVSDGLVYGQTIRITPTDKQLVALAVRKIVHTPELWAGHYHDKEIVVCFFLHRSSNRRGCYQNTKAFCREFRCTRWIAKQQIRAAMLYFAKLWGEDDE